ncbi:hypothetical protein ACFVTQ_14055, partial [Streptomyces cyaneofuscatus]
AREPWAVVLYAAAICLIDLLQLAMFTMLRFRHGVRAVGEWRDTAADLSATIAVFGASVPVAFFAPQAAMWCWLALFPVKEELTRRNRSRPSASHPPAGYGILRPRTAHGRLVPHDR